MTRVLVLFIAVILLSGCEPSFKEEYEAVKQELEITKLALEKAEQKLKATNNEVRNKIFTLIRRSNIHLQSQSLELGKLREYGQKLDVHLESYNQLSGKKDHISATTNFYAVKLLTIRELITKSRSVYNRRYNECLSGIGSKESDKSELSSMLCEVQAAVAQQKSATELKASIESLLAISAQQLQAGRQANSSSKTFSDLENQFKAQVSDLIKQAR